MKISVNLSLSFLLFAANACLLPVSGCVGLPHAYQGSLLHLAPPPPAFPQGPLFLPFFFLGESGGVPLGSLCALLSIATLGMGPCPAGIPIAPLFLALSLSLPSLTCSFILYRIFVYHPYSCQPLFSLRESITLDFWLVCQSYCGLFIPVLAVDSHPLRFHLLL